ncbi:MAG: stage III sporulation protein AE [Bacillota bacterium]|jgi:stage III sporulation protein AE
MACSKVFKKCLGLVFIPIAMAVLSFSVCRAESNESLWEKSLDNLDDSGMGRPMDEIFDDIFQARGPGYKEIVKDILSGKGIGFGQFLKRLAGVSLGEFPHYAKILGQIVLIGVAIASLSILGETLSADGSSRIAITSAHMVLVLLSVLSFRDVLAVATEAVQSLRTAFFAFIPALIGLVLASGAPVTSGVLHPAVFGMGSLVSIIILDVAFPLVFTSIAIDMAGNFGGGERVSGVSDMLRQIASIGIGFSMASFVGVVAGERAAAGVADGIALRTAKYMSSTFIPVAGKMVGDTMDMFFHSILALRSAVGIAGILAIIGVVFSPLVKVIACLAAWRVALAVLGPTCGIQVRRSLQAMVSGVAFLAVTLFATSFVFVICLSLVAQAVRSY